MNVIKLLLFSMGLVLGSCSDSLSKFHLVDDFEIPEEAYDVQKIRLGTGNSQQLFYRLLDEYPSTGSLNFHDAIFEAQNWRKCSGHSREWGYFEDSSSQVFPHIHRIASYWLHEEGPKLAILSVTYYSNILSSRRPNNQVQNIALIIQTAIDLQLELNRLSLSCE